MATGILPLYSRGKIPVVKFPWSYRGSYFVKKNKKHRRSIRRGLVFHMMLLPLLIHWYLYYG